MAQPTPYEREFNFSNQQAATPSTPVPAPHLDAEFNRVKRTTDEILANLALFQNDEGEVTIGYDQLDPEILGDLIAAGVDPGAFDTALAGSDVFNDAIDAKQDTSVPLNVTIMHDRFENILQYLPESRHANIMNGTNVADCTSGIQDAAYEVASKGGRLVFPGRGPYLISEQIDFVAQVNGPEPDFTSNGQLYVVSDVQPIVLEASHEAIIKPLADMESMFNIHWNAGPTYFHQAPWYSEVRGFWCDARGFTVDRFVYVSSGFGATFEKNRVVGPDKAFYADGAGGFKIAHNRLTTKYGIYTPQGGGDSRIYGNDIYPRDGGAGIRLGYYGGDTQIQMNTFTGNGVDAENMVAILLQGNATALNTHGNIDISANEFNAMLGVQTIQAAAFPNIYNISIHHNHTAAYGAVNRGALVKAEGVSGLIISENFGNWRRTSDATMKAIELLNCEAPSITGNKLNNYLDTPIQLTDCLSAQIDDNTLWNFGKSSASTKEGVRLAGSTFQSKLKGNSYIQDSASYAQRGVVETGAADFNTASDEKFQSVGNAYVTANTVSFMHRKEFGYAAPTTGTWRVGDVIFNHAVGLNAPVSWICTTAGSPGTWTAQFLEGRNYTAANIASAAHSVNTSGKRAGVTVFDTTNNRLMVSSGSAATAPWYVADASASVTPS